MRKLLLYILLLVGSVLIVMSLWGMVLEYKQNGLYEQAKQENPDKLILTEYGTLESKYAVYMTMFTGVAMIGLILVTIAEKKLTYLGGKRKWRGEKYIIPYLILILLGMHFITASINLLFLFSGFLF